MTSFTSHPGRRLLRMIAASMVAVVLGALALLGPAVSAQAVTGTYDYSLGP
ncbi:hypothetical protein [Nonomuraea sp. NPDC003804]|uniref:hypothetical protein n=1 Tax=Nonomuraea sp. NPDC003804 TaxID=3154547 RepID=UPI0033AD4DB7